VIIAHLACNKNLKICCFETTINDSVVYYDNNIIAKVLYSLTAACN